MSRGSVLHFERNCSDIFSIAIASGVGDGDDDDAGGNGNDDDGVDSISFDGTVTYGVCPSSNIVRVVNTCVYFCYHYQDHLHQLMQQVDQSLLPHV